MSTGKKWLPALLFLFTGSGCAALIYEVVWFQMLELFIGSSAVSVAVLLGTFMGGMGAGSLLAPRLISTRLHPLRVYAALELGIGVFGVLLLILLPLVGRLYISWGADEAGLLLRGIIAGICLLAPTCAMGATLPVAARWVSQTPAGIAWLGWFYAGNIVGAVFGSLLAGFYLLRVYDMATATYVACAINAVVAFVSLALAAATPSRLQLDSPTNAETARTPNTRARGGRQAAVPAGPPATAVYVAIALSGFSALAGQVVWTRILALLFGATVYTFSIILAVFLFGLGIGSGVGAWIGQSIKRPHVALGWCQLLAVGAIAWTAFMLSSALPFWPVVPAVSPHLRYNFQIDLAHALLAILPAPLLWGMSFPLALASVASKEDQDPGRLVGEIYAANTVGAILGALSASLLLVASLGSQRAQQIMMGLSAVAGLLVIVGQSRGRRTLSSSIGLLGVMGVAVWLILMVPAIPGVLVAYGRNSATWVGHTGEILYVGEGLNSSVAVSRLPTGALTYHNAGKIQASSQPQDMRLQRMLGHLSTLIPRNPRSVLVIGCGSGITAGAVSIDPRVERQTIVEIERLVPPMASNYFGPYNFEVVENPKVRIQIDDARHYLLTRNEKFDVITADPFDPWVRGAATLYTKEFFEAARARLNPGGVVTMWVPLYTTTPEAVKSQVGTFFDVFPEGFVLANTYQTKGYDIVLVGQHSFAPIDLDEIDARLERADYAPVKQSFGEIGFRSAADLFASYSGRAADLKPWLADAEINRDGNLRLQYLAGLGLNVNQPDVIYQQMLRYRRSSEGLFTGSESRRAQLQSAIGQQAAPKPQP